MMLPVPVLIYPATLTPVPVIVTMPALPETPTVTFPSTVTILTLLVPFAILYDVAADEALPELPVVSA